LQPADPGRGDVDDRGDPDHAGHRGHRADPWHGDRRERADLRTRARGAAQRIDAACGDPRRLRQGLGHDSRRQRHPPDRRAGTDDDGYRRDPRLRRHAGHRHPDLDVHLGGDDARVHRADSRPPQAQDAVGVIMEIFNHNSNIHFLRIRVFSIAVAIVLMVASIALIATKGLNYGLDFTGGVSLVVDYAQPVQTGDVRDALAKGGLEDLVVQSVGGSREVSIRMQPTKEMLDAKGQVDLDKVASTVMQPLKAARADATLKSRSSVSAEVGAELKSDGMVAAVFVILGIMAYLWIRFERRFAIAAVLTEIHDTLVTLGVL